MAAAIQSHRENRMPGTGRLGGASAGLAGENRRGNNTL